MKFILKPILKYYLKYVTKLVLFIHRPKIIAVAGSTNKSFVRDEIRRVLEKRGVSVRANVRSFNTEIGLPLAVLNLPSGYNSYCDWLPTLGQSLKSLFSFSFPEVLVLELGASSQGDMRHLCSIVRPTISVITNITQRYLEAFSDMDDLAGEYETLVKKTDPGGLVVLNYDNIRLRGVYDKLRRKKSSFGFSEGADWQATEVSRRPSGEVFKIKHLGSLSPAKVARFGQHHILADMVRKIILENIGLIKKC